MNYDTNDRLLVRRPELRIIISSATLNAEMFRDFFNEGQEQQVQPPPQQQGKYRQQPVEKQVLPRATIISAQGRVYPVDIHYLQEPCSNYVTTAVKTVMEIHANVGEL